MHTRCERFQLFLMEYVIGTETTSYSATTRQPDPLTGYRNPPSPANASPRTLYLSLGASKSTYISFVHMTWHTLCGQKCRITLQCKFIELKFTHRKAKLKRWWWWKCDDDDDDDDVVYSDYDDDDDVVVVVDDDLAAAGLHVF